MLPEAVNVRVHGAKGLGQFAENIGLPSKSDMTLNAVTKERLMTVEVSR